MAVALCPAFAVASPASAAPQRHLTVPRASREIRSAAQGLARGRAAIAIAERLGALQIKADVEWEERGLNSEERDCEAFFFARLTPSGRVAIRHGPIECRASF
jgi:hypothetical protein